MFVRDAPQSSPDRSPCPVHHALFGEMASAVTEELLTGLSMAASDGAAAGA